jgi:hypothetical protein
VATEKDARMKLQSTALGLIALAAVALPGAARADVVNLVQNGSFSLTTLNASGQLSGGNVTDWATTSGYTFLYTTIKNHPTESEAGSSNNGTGVSLYGTGTYLPVSPDGGNFLAADSAYSTGTLSQTLIGLVTGATYAVSFYQAAGQQTGNFNGATTDTWIVGLGSSTQDAPTQSVANHGFDNWMQVTLDFVATATSELLSFTATGTPGQSQPPFALLDGVSAVQISQPVPEPPAYAVMLVALLGVLGARKLWTRRA